MAKIVFAAVTETPALSMMLEAPPDEAVLRQTLVTIPEPVLKFVPVVMFSADLLGTDGRKVCPLSPPI
jgi:hypothetical protein